ncbi:hypothetical protein [Calidithermus chliarophilus]|uniref:hypothetical protein n=1 Tax=Calidithermus chliarophilus TaxID=52023 RepID=UPI0003F5F781|nr:hypothetical protein [Calidithermus chliarophilus]
MLQRPKWLTNALLERIRDLRAQGLGRPSIARALGLTAYRAETALSYLKHLEQAAPAPADPDPAEAAPAPVPLPLPPKPALSVTQEGQTATVSSGKGPRVRTLEELLAGAQVDRSLWEVERYKVNAYEVATKVRRARADLLGELRRAVEEALAGGHEDVAEHLARVLLSGFLEEQVQVHPLYQTSAVLRPLSQGAELKALKEEVLEAMRAHAPRGYAPLSRRGGGGHVLVLSLPDAHLAKLVDPAETGETWSPEEARRVFLESWRGLLELASHRADLERILIPLGNDFLHTDSPANATSAGTPQDASLRYRQAKRLGRELLVEALDMARAYAPLDVFGVPGNHAREAELDLVELLAAWYRHDPEVSVDDAPTTRKYRRYGVNLFGFTHGDQENPADLPQLMALEAEALWAGARVREWFTGHFHRKGERSFLPLRERGGVLVRVLPALTAADAYHARKGYVGNVRRAEAYLYHLSRGYAGHVAYDPF